MSVNDKDSGRESQRNRWIVRRSQSESYSDRLTKALGAIVTKKTLRQWRSSTKKLVTEYLWTFIHRFAVFLVCMTTKLLVMSPNGQKPASSDVQQLLSPINSPIFIIFFLSSFKCRVTQKVPQMEPSCCSFPSSWRNKPMTHRTHGMLYGQSRPIKAIRRVYLTSAVKVNILLKP